jgi:ABC-type enterochelin transport system ATPase subunit
MSMLEGSLYIVKTRSNYIMKGFTLADMRVLGRLARKKYKLKTKRKRILKKYIKTLMNTALQEQLSGNSGKLKGA